MRFSIHTTTTRVPPEKVSTLTQRCSRLRDETFATQCNAQTEAFSPILFCIIKTPPEAFMQKQKYYPRTAELQSSEKFRFESGSPGKRIFNLRESEPFFTRHFYPEREII